MTMTTFAHGFTFITYKLLKPAGIFTHGWATFWGLSGESRRAALTLDAPSDPHPIRPLLIHEVGRTRSLAQDALLHPFANTRIRALAALAKADPQVALPVWAEALLDDQFTVREAAARQIENFLQATFPEHFPAAGESNVPLVSIVQILTRREAAASESELMPAYNHFFAAVLDEVTDHPYLELLIVRALGTPGTLNLTAAQVFLTRPTVSFPLLVRAHQHAKESPVKEDLLASLIILHEEDSTLRVDAIFPALRWHVESSTSKIRETACALLGRVSDNLAIQAAQAILDVMTKEQGLASPKEYAPANVDGPSALYLAARQAMLELPYSGGLMFIQYPPFYRRDAVIRSYLMKACAAEKPTSTTATAYMKGQILSERNAQILQGWLSNNVGLTDDAIKSELEARVALLKKKLPTQMVLYLLHRHKLARLVTLMKKIQAALRRKKEAGEKALRSSATTAPAAPGETVSARLQTLETLLHKGPPTDILDIIAGHYQPPGAEDVNETLTEEREAVAPFRAALAASAEAIDNLMKVKPENMGTSSTLPPELQAIDTQLNHILCEALTSRGIATICLRVTPKPSTEKAAVSGHTINPYPVRDFRPLSAVLEWARELPATINIINVSDGTEIAEVELVEETDHSLGALIRRLKALYLCQRALEDIERGVTVEDRLSFFDAELRRNARTLFAAFLHAYLLVEAIRSAEQSEA